ncbi:glycosyl hydrolase [Streptomyces sp. SID8379]|uniref:glycosyl hydrolase family 18 protein n=1 Tax=unclassified Streptomyces TaxID=2593676 RepID=UPI00037E9386|nr:MULTISPECIES: glycosyl hydrolase family 18 protein [unclassified Streptomyces]MYW63239.1 glycosyl hydrolase [Streptomyces sp. SID8379]
MARRIHLTVLAVLATALTPAAAHAADALPPPRTVSAWLPYWDQEPAYRNALAHAAQIRTISPFWYETKSATRVDGHPGAGDRRIVNGLHAKGIQVVPTVMEQMKPGALGAVMTSPARRADHVEALIAVVRSRAYDGLDLDYETIAPTPEAKYRAVRAGYAIFVTDLCARLHTLHKQCFVTVTPKTRTAGRIWDYQRLGAAADRMRIMGYNLHYAEGRPGPLSTPEWYDEILATATAQVPRAKLEMGLPAYGWDWADGGKERAKHVTWKDAEALRRKEKAPYALDPVSGTPHFTYKDGDTRRTVWYQDARGTAAHLPVLRKYGIRNTVLWALNFEDPEVWRTLAAG